MASDTKEIPLPTPHPDQPRQAEGEAAPRGREPGQPSREYDSDENAYDSVHDDLTLKLAEQLSEPDPR